MGGLAFAARFLRRVFFWDVLVRAASLVVFAFVATRLPNSLLFFFLWLMVAAQPSMEILI